MSETHQQVAAQCRAVAHLCRAIADIHDDHAKMAANDELKGLHELWGKRSAALMETLGDILNGMDAVTEDDAWLSPIFAEAQRRWPVERNPPDV